jgi:hypothetical protein
MSELQVTGAGLTALQAQERQKIQDPTKSKRKSGLPPSSFCSGSSPMCS